MRSAAGIDDGIPSGGVVEVIRFVKALQRVYFVACRFCVRRRALCAQSAVDHARAQLRQRYRARSQLISGHRTVVNIGSLDLFTADFGAGHCACPQLCSSHCAVIDVGSFNRSRSGVEFGGDRLRQCRIFSAGIGNLGHNFGKRAVRIIADLSRFGDILRHPDIQGARHRENIIATGERNLHRHHAAVRRIYDNRHIIVSVVNCTRELLIDQHIVNSDRSCGGTSRQRKDIAFKEELNVEFPRVFVLLRLDVVREGGL